MIRLKIADKTGTVLAEGKGEKEAYLYYDKKYLEGDVIHVVREQESEEAIFLHVFLDDAVGESLVYFPTKEFSYKVPFGNEKLNLSSKAFSGTGHLLSVRIAEDYEMDSYRCLSENKWDQGEEVGIYPHAFSNIETRGEVVFAARNVIDGLHISTYHGEWPYTSWGPDLLVEDYYLQINFGREVNVDRVLLHLRTDFPHDSWWKSGRLSFSDGSQEEIQIEKCMEKQNFSFTERKTSWVRLDQLVCDERSDSPFPALMQMQVWGRG
ncbi:MAG: carbohydrate-binding protein [Marvinbryantia sp.]|jgi:hypothetical protein